MVNKLHIAPNGYCVHHSSIQLKRLRPRTGIWVTILNSCPLCEIDCEEGSEIDSSTNDVTGKTPSTSFTSPPPRHRRTLATTPKHPSQQQRLLQEASSVPSRLSSLTCLTEEEQQRLLLQEVSRALSFLQNRLSPSLRMTEEEGRDSKNKSHHENVYTRSNMPPLPPPPPPPSRSQAQDQDMSAPQPQMSQKKSSQLPPEEETSTKQTEKTPPMCQNFDLSPPPPRQHQRTSTDYGVTLASIPEEEEDTNEEQMLHDDLITQPLPQKSLQKKSPHPSFQEKTSQIQLQEKTLSTTTRKHEQSRSNEHPHKNKSKDARRSRSSNRRSSAPDGQSEMTNKIENKLRRYKSSTLICGGASIYSIASAPTKLGEVIGMERPQDEKETLIVNGDDDAKIQPLPQKSLQKKSPHPRTSQEKTPQIQSEEKASSTTTRKHEQSRSNEHPHNKKSKDARRSKSSSRRSSAPDGQFEMTSKIENKLRRNKSSTLIRGGASVNSMASAPTKIEEVIGMEHHQHKQETLSVNGDDDAKTQPLPQKSLQKKSPHPRSQEKTSQIQSEEKASSTTRRKHEQSRSNEHPHKSNDARRSRSSSRRSSAPDGQSEMTSKIENKLRRNKSSTLIRGGASVNSIASAPTKIDESLTVNVQQAKLTHNHGDSVQYSSMTHTDLVPHEHGLMVRDNRAKNDGKASKHGQRRQHRSQERKNRSSSSSSRRYESKSESIVNHCNTSEIVGSKYCHNDEAGSESRYSRSSSQTKELKNVVNEIYKSRHTANGDNISKQDNIIAFPIHMNGGGSKRSSKRRSSNNNSITHVKSSMATKDNLRRVANSNSMTPSTKFRQNWSSSCPKENWTVR